MRMVTMGLVFAGAVIASFSGSALADSLPVDGNGYAVETFSPDPRKTLSYVLPPAPPGGDGLSKLTIPLPPGSYFFHPVVEVISEMAFNDDGNYWTHIDEVFIKNSDINSITL